MTVVVLATTLAACTAGFVYNRLDWLVAWYVSDYVTLDDGQEAVLRESVRRTMAWHRDTQVPRYIALLEEMAAESAAPVTAARLQERYDQVVALLDEFLRVAAPATADAFRQLTPAQLAELRENLEQENVELWDEFAGDTPAERLERRRGSAEKAMRRFIGRLRDEQRAVVEARLATLDDLSSSWIDRRRHWQDRLLAILSAPPPDAAFGAALRELFVDPNQFDGSDYRRRVDANRAIVLAMIAELSVSFSPAQRSHLQGKFNEFAADLRKLAAAT
jgi:hypothetical protein